MMISTRVLVVKVSSNSGGLAEGELDGGDREDEEQRW